MTFFYVQLNNDQERRVIGVTQTAGSVDSPLMIAIPAYDESLLGKVHDEKTGEFVAPPPPVDLRPEIVITHMEADKAGALIEGTTELTCTEGTVVTVFAELRHQGVRVPMNQTFRMPLRASDGRDRVLLADMVDGVITIRAPLRESGVWKVTEAAINEALQPEMHMRFAGLRLFVLVE